MPDAASEELDFARAAAVRRELADDARRFVREDPARSTALFRERIRPFLSAGRAWLVEPSVRVLLTELRQHEDVWVQFGEEAQRLLFETEEAQDNAAALAEVDAKASDVARADTDPERVLVEAMEAPKANRHNTKTLEPKFGDLEQVQVKWATLKESALYRESALDSLLIGGGLTFLGSASGAEAARVAEASHVLKRNSGTRHGFHGLWLPTRWTPSLWRWRRRAEPIDLLQRRILSAVFYIPTNQAMLLTIFRGDESKPTAADVYVAQLTDQALERIRERAGFKVVRIGVRRPVHLGSKEAVALAEWYVRGRHSATRKLDGQAVDLGIMDIEPWSPESNPAAPVKTAAWRRSGAGA